MNGNEKKLMTRITMLERGVLLKIRYLCCLMEVHIYKGSQLAS
jgi:hypothetical protein